MKPFSLHTVLDYRKSLEDKAKNALLKAKNEESKIQELIDKTHHQYQRCLAENNDLQKQDCSILDLVRSEEKITYIKQQLKHLNATLALKRKAVQKAHQSLVQCSQKKKVMENLKEKQDLEWRSYVNKKEAAMLDEIAILRQHTK